MKLIPEMGVVLKIETTDMTRFSLSPSFSTFDNYDKKDRKYSLVIFISSVVHYKRVMSRYQDPHQTQRLNAGKDAIKKTIFNTLFALLKVQYISRNKRPKNIFS